MLKPIIARMIPTTSIIIPVNLILSSLLRKIPVKERTGLENNTMAKPFTNNRIPMTASITPASIPVKENHTI